MMRWVRALWLIAALSLLFLLPGCGSGDRGVSSAASSASSSTPSSDASSDVSADELPTFGEFIAVDMETELVDESIFSDADLTMLNVWGTFCGPCLVEMPYLGELAGEYADRGVQIVGVVIDVFDQSGKAVPQQIATAMELIAETNADYLHLIPSYEMYTTTFADLVYIPETYFIDSEGRILGQHTGSQDKDEWQAMLDMYLAEAVG